MMQNTGMEGSNPAVGYAEGDQGGSRMGRVTESAQEALERITRAATDAKERLSARTDELWALQGRAVETARNYAKANPLAAIGIAIAVGVLLSKLLSRK